MIYQLPTGKAVEMTVDQYLRLSDQDFQQMIASDMGEEFHDPFTKSVIRKGSLAWEGIDEVDREDLTEDELIELENTLGDGSVFDEDFIDFDNLEQ